MDWEAMMMTFFLDAMATEAYHGVEVLLRMLARLI
jgi:hypothetical protein